MFKLMCCNKIDKGVFKVYVFSVAREAIGWMTGYWLMLSIITKKELITIEYYVYASYAFPSMCVVYVFALFN